MTLTATSPKPRAERDRRGAGLLGALLAVPILFSTAPAAADRERGMPAQASGQAQSAPAPAPSAPSYSPPPSAPSYQPAPARSDPPASAPSSGSSSASAPSRGSSGSGPGVVRSEPRGGGHDGSSTSSRGYSGGHGSVSARPRGSFHPRPYRSPRRQYHPPHRWNTAWTWGGPWDWWRWGGSWGPYWGWGWGWGGVVVIDDEPYSDRYARVDTDVRPESAEVYLDGTYVGSADDFDGFPDYLYLEPGKYRFEFRHPSYETVVKELEIRRGQQLRFGDEMKLLPGKDRMGGFDPERRGTPLGRVFGKPEPERRGRDRTGRFEATAAPDVAPDEDLDELEELEELDADDEDEEDVAREPRPAPPAPPMERSAPPAPADDVAPAERGRLRFEVEPGDAAVYLDDRYVGTGEELAGLRRGYPVKPGKHTVTVVRPGYATRTFEVEAKPATALDVVVELEK